MSKENPNIILILADDLGYGDIGCYNPESKVPTPNLDRLAQEGLMFMDAHAPSTVCTPSRYSVLTGRMAFRTGIKGVFTGAGGPSMIEEGNGFSLRIYRRRPHPCATDRRTRQRPVAQASVLSRQPTGADCAGF